MSSITVVIQGLCLWLSSAAAIEDLGGLPGILPEFANLTPAHNAMLVIPQDGFVGNQCPSGFSDLGTFCSFPLNGKGGPGGVKVSFLTGEATGAPAPGCALCAIPPIQHSTPFELKEDYKLPSGSKIAAHVIIDQGSVSSTWDEACQSTTGNCPRMVEWSLSSATGPVRLVLSNLLTGSSIEAPLQNGASVRLMNSPLEVAAMSSKRKKKAAHVHANSGEKEDWCLYFQMFEGNPPCPGIPPLPDACQTCLTPGAKKKAAVKPAAKRWDVSFADLFDIQTIACSNSQYP